MSISEMMLTRVYVMQRMFLDVESFSPAINCPKGCFSPQFNLSGRIFRIILSDL